MTSLFYLVLCVLTASASADDHALRPRSPHCVDDGILYQADVDVEDEAGKLLEVASAKAIKVWTGVVDDLEAVWKGKKITRELDLLREKSKEEDLTEKDLKKLNAIASERFAKLKKKFTLVDEKHVFFSFEKGGTSIGEVIMPDYPVELTVSVRANFGNVIAGFSGSAPQNDIAKALAPLGALDRKLPSAGFVWTNARLSRSSRE